jgi:segregation and condensation protein B
MDLKSILESLIFASDKPITLKQLKAVTGNTAAEKLRAALDDIQVEFRDSGIQLAEVGGGYQFRTHPDNAHWVKKLLAGRPPRLTQAMLETLAIVAYRQPVTRPEIEDIRGVDCGGVLRLLLERSLIRIMGKKEEVGRPILYGSTKQFLEFFNLKDLKELPTLKEFTELSEENSERVDEIYEAEDEPALPAEAASGALPTAAVASGVASAEAGPAETVMAISQEDVVDAIMTPEIAGDATEVVDEAFAADSDGAPAAEGTWARRAPLLAEEEDDGSLDALDRALEHVDGILRQHRQAEQTRLEATVGPLVTGEPTPDAAPVADAPIADAPIADAPITMPTEAIEAAPREAVPPEAVEAVEAAPTATVEPTVTAEEFIEAAPPVIAEPAPATVVDEPSRDDGQEGAPVL